MAVCWVRISPDVCRLGATAIYIRERKDDAGDIWHHVYANGRILNSFWSLTVAKAWTAEKYENGNFHHYQHYLRL